MIRIDVTRGDAGAIKRSTRGLHRTTLAPSGIPLRSIVRRIEPFDRAHRIASLDAGDDEYIGELRMRQRIWRRCGAREIGDRRLFKK